jgi:hypothetical protein
LPAAQIAIIISITHPHLVSLVWWNNEISESKVAGHADSQDEGEYYLAVEPAIGTLVKITTEGLDLRSCAITPAVCDLIRHRFPSPYMITPI